MMAKRRRTGRTTSFVSAYYAPCAMRHRLLVFAILLFHQSHRMRRFGFGCRCFVWMAKAYERMSRPDKQEICAKYYFFHIFLVIFNSTCHEEVWIWMQIFGLEGEAVRVYGECPDKQEICAKYILLMQALGSEFPRIIREIPFFTGCIL